jgi:photosystem II stability/assembly factor-like uncharacterized protein
MRASTKGIAMKRNSALIAIGLVVSLSLLTGLSTANVNVSKSGWSWGNPTPQGRTLRALAFSEGVGYAVGYGGTALSIGNAGQSWGGLATGTAANLERVQALSSSTVVVGGGAGCVTRISTDGGRLFRRIFNVAETGCPEPVAAFSFLSPQVGFLLLGNGSVEETTDGGETFSRKTGIPGTAASSGGGELVGTDIHFATAANGIAFVSSPKSGASAAYATPDGGVSWTPVALPSGARVTAVHFVDANNAYAIGPETLLRSTDGGEEWKAQPIAAGKSFNSIDCATATACILTVTAGNVLVETADGGATDSEKTTSSSLIYGAAYSSPTQIVAVGAVGATVLSSDGGATFTPASADIGGQYGRLRLGPAGTLLAPGAKGDLALSTNGGESWKVIATQTSQELLDVAFGTPALGYALDVKGGLQRTTNGGASWQTLSPGTATPADAVVALGESTALLVGPVGVYRAVGGGRFEPVAGKTAATAHVSDYDLAGSTVFAFGPGGRTLIRSTDGGAKWTAVKMPLARKAGKKDKGKGKKAKRVKGRPGVSIRSVAFTSAEQGMLLDTEGRLWSTADGGARWTEVLSAGTSEGIQVAFSDPAHGFMSVKSFGGDSQDAYVLRTSNGGATWHPQEITFGSIPGDGLLALGPLDAAVLVDSVSATPAQETLDRLFFTTTSGGDVAGTEDRLSLSTPTPKLTARRLKAAHGAVTIDGTLSGALGGEQVVVSRRDLSGGPWQHQEVTAGVNGGSFTSTWHIARSSVFVAQWAGDSGRPGQGSAVLKMIVRRPRKRH